MISKSGFARNLSSFRARSPSLFDSEKNLLSAQGKIYPNDHLRGKLASIRMVATFRPSSRMAVLMRPVRPRTRLRQSATSTRP